MARPGWPERNRAARSFRQLRRFHHVINSDKVFGTHSRSPNTTTWSRHSLRIEPISRSAYPFCHGERGDVGRSRMPIDRSLRMKTSLSQTCHPAKYAGGVVDLLFIPCCKAEKQSLLF